MVRQIDDQGLELVYQETARDLRAWWWWQQQGRLAGLWGAAVLGSFLGATGLGAAWAVPWVLAAAGWSVGAWRTVEPAAADPVHVQADPAGLSWRRRGADHHLAWRAVDGVMLGPRHLVLLAGGVPVLAIPRRVLGSAAEEARLVACLTAWKRTPGAVDARPSGGPGEGISFEMVLGPEDRARFQEVWQRRPASRRGAVFSWVLVGLGLVVAPCVVDNVSWASVASGLAGGFVWSVLGVVGFGAPRVYLWWLGPEGLATSGRRWHVVLGPEGGTLDQGDEHVHFGWSDTKNVAVTGDFLVVHLGDRPLWFPVRVLPAPAAEIAARCEGWRTEVRVPRVVSRGTDVFAPPGSP